MTISLFDNQSAKNLVKVPYDFSYKYLSGSDTLHNQKVTDWEVYQAYRRFRDEYRSESIALRKLKEKYMGFFTDPLRDSYLIVGIVYPHPAFIVIGVFSYKKDKKEIETEIQTSLF